jgi:hypothetical protein
MNIQNNLYKNLRVLEKKQPAVARFISSAQVNQQEILANIIINQSNYIDWKMPDGSTLLGNNPDLTNNYRHCIPAEDNKTRISFLVGLNLGYGLNQVLQKSPDGHKVGVLEPKVEILLACLILNDYTSFIESAKLFFLVPENSYLQNIMYDFDVHDLWGKMHIHLDEPSMRLGQEYVHWYYELARVLKRSYMEMKTLRLGQDRMVSNELDNFTEALDAGSIKPLYQAANRLQTIILGVGPSLTRFVDEIKKSKEESLLVTSLQALPALKNIGIKPHICMCIDFTKGMRRVYERLDQDWARDIPMIYSTKTDPQVISSYPGPKLPVWCKGGLGTHIVSVQEPILDAGSNVAVALIRFFYWAGVRQFVLAGQDFAWSGESTHLNGHHASQKKFNFNPKSHIQLKNKYGQNIFTTQTYLSAITDLEESLKVVRDCEVYNLYGGGIQIQGSVDIDSLNDIENVRQSSIKDNEIFWQKFASCFRSQPRPNLPLDTSNWVTSLRRVEKRVEKLFKRLDQNQVHIQKAIQQIDLFLRQNPLYVAYIYNEIRDIQLLINQRREFNSKDLAKCKQIIKKVIKKIKEIETKLYVKEVEKQKLTA